MLLRDRTENIIAQTRPADAAFVIHDQCLHRPASVVAITVVVFDAE